MRTIIIGCGYVGSSLARFWRSCGYHVAVTTRNIEKRDALCTIADEVHVGTEWGRIASTKEIVVVAVAPDSIDQYENTYLGTARSLLPFLDTQQVIYLSSTSVYGDNTELYVTEETPLRPNSPQAKILAETEKLYINANGCVLRLGEIVGPGRSPVDRLKSGVTLPGNGENPINLSPLDTIVNAIDFASTHKLKGIFNICSDDHRSRKNYYESICNENSIPSPQWDPSKKSMHGGRRIVVCEKIKALGFSLN